MLDAAALVPVLCVSSVWSLLSRSSHNPDVCQLNPVQALLIKHTVTQLSRFASVEVAIGVPPSEKKKYKKSMLISI